MKIVVIAAVIAPLAACYAGNVEFRECPKCDKRIKIDLKAKKAYVNLSTLEGSNKESLAARAEKLLADAKIPPASDPKIRPLMGWSSWNTFGVDISEEVILETARAMATNGLKDAGYTYVNIDDGFFDGHGEDGILRIHPKRFPNGMKVVADGIHAVGLKAGTYSDAGADTCGSMGGDKGGVGAGLFLGFNYCICKIACLLVGKLKHRKSQAHSALLANSGESCEALCKLLQCLYVLSHIRTYRAYSYPW